MPVPPASKTLRNGLRATIHMTNGDEYTGYWENDKKSGEFASDYCLQLLLGLFVHAMFADQTKPVTRVYCQSIECVCTCKNST